MEFRHWSLECTAVFAGPTGLEVIENLISAAHTALRPSGYLIMEISGTIADRVRALHGWEDITLTNDLQGISRVASARKPHSWARIDPDADLAGLHLRIDLP